MGCSASRLDTLIAKAIEDPSFSSSKNPKTRSLYLSTPLVHHPALSKGDTNHLVCLTSSTYGSLNDNVVVGEIEGKNDCFLGENDGFLDELSPDSVINAWELMEGLEDVEIVDDFRVKSRNLRDLGFNCVGSEKLCDFNDARRLPGSKFRNFSDFNDAQKLPGSKLGKCSDFNDARKSPGSKFGSDFRVKSEKLGDFDEARISSVSKSGMNVGGYDNLCDFNEARKSSVLKSGMDFVGCGGGGGFSYNDGYYSPVSRSGVDFVGYGPYSGDYKVKSEDLGDFNDARKLPVSKSWMNYTDAGKSPDSRSGMNLVDCSRDFKLMSSNFSGFNDARKMPASELGLNSPDSVMKLSDSYVFVDYPNEIVEEETRFELSPSTKPLWKHLSEESLLSKMDPYVGNAYEKALAAKRHGYDQSRTGSKSLGSSPLVSKSKNMGSRSPVVLKLRSMIDTANKLSMCEDKIVLYFTSLRGIRKTYEDCSTVRMILKGFRVVVDERDISMDSSYRKELQSALVGKPMSLPQLFIRGKHIGGADDVKLLHETGELERILEGYPTMDSESVCQSCGDARFVPCSNCYGSRKVFHEDEGQMRKCPDCNENGLLRCPDCCP